MSNLVLFVLFVLSLILFRRAFLSSKLPMIKICLAIYFVNFLLGHVILTFYRLLFRPDSYILLADLRLLESKLDIKFLLFLNIAQFLLVCLGTLISGDRYVKDNEPEIKFFSRDLTTAIILMTLVGWIGNIAVYFGNVNIFSAFHPFELLGTAWLVSGFRLINFKKFILIAIASSHFIWAVFIFKSKSEAFLILVALAIRFLHSKTKVRIYQISAISLVGILLFPFIQVQKGILTLSKIQNQLDSQGEQFTFLKSFGLSFLQRFDGADSITDAYSASAGSWYTPIEYMRVILSKLIPNISFLLGDYFGENTSTTSSLGQMWNDQMRTISIEKVTYGIPVTFGPMAEGYAISGMILGLFLCLTFGIIMKKLCSACYSQKLFSVTCGFYYMCHLENLQNSIGSTILMVPKMLECYLVLRIFQIFSSKPIVRFLSN